ncbi:hypothetical protein L195_g046322, partial [Trifolium pratense]
MIHNKEVNIRLNKSQKIIEDKKLTHYTTETDSGFSQLVLQGDTQSSLAGSTVVADTDEGKEVDDTGTEEAASTGGSSELAGTGVDTEEAASTSVGSNEVEMEATSADDNNEVDREAASAAGDINI